MQDSPEWVGRTVGTKKYRPPEMRDGRAATSAIDIYCFGLMAEKLLRQRGRASLDSSPRSDAGRAERRDVKLLHELAAQSTSREPLDRPSAWGLLVRMQRHAGEDVLRCHDPRTLVPLSATPQQPGNHSHGSHSHDSNAEEGGELNGSGGRGSGGREQSHSQRGSREGGSREQRSSERKKRRRSADEAEPHGRAGKRRGGA